MGLTIRNLERADREAAASALSASDAFTQEEVSIALGVLDDATAESASGYAAFAAEEGGSFLGYVCGGSTPLTESTWHVYWICVHPRDQGRGVGRALTERFEASVRSQGGRRIVVETSGRRDYSRARRFYEDAGYRQVGRIPDFYRRGDDAVVYFKELA